MEGRLPYESLGETGGTASKQMRGEGDFLLLPGLWWRGDPVTRRPAAKGFAGGCGHVQSVS